MSISKRIFLLYTIVVIETVVALSMLYGFDYLPISRSALVLIIAMIVGVIIFLGIIHQLFVQPVKKRLKTLHHTIEDLLKHGTSQYPLFDEPEFQQIVDTVSKRAKELHRQKFMLDWILDHMPAGVIIYQPTVVYANRYTLEHLETNIASLQKMTPIDFLEDQQEKKEKFLAIMLERMRGEGERVSYETTLRTDQKTIHVFAVSDTIEYNDKPAGIVTFIDISELRKVESELAQLQRHLPMVAYHITRTSDGDKIHYISDAITDLTGYSPDEVKSQSNWWGSHIHPDDYEQVKLDQQRLFSIGKLHHRYRLLRKDGTYLWVDERVVLLSYQDGAREFAGFWNDVTREKIWQFAHNALADANESMLRAKSEIKLLKRVCQAVVESGLCCYAWVGKANDQDQYLTSICRYPETEDYDKQIKVTLDQTLFTSLGPVGKVARGVKEIVFNSDTRTNPAIAPWREAMLSRGFLSSVSISIEAESDTTLTLNLYADLPNWFDYSLNPLLMTLAKNIGFAIRDLKNREKLQYLSYHDALCGLPNINALKSRLASLKGAAAIAVINIHDFSTVNLNFGYSLGNVILCQTAKAIMECVTKKDTLYHLGGDKFALLVLDADKSEMEAIACRIQRRLVKGVKAEQYTIPIYLRMGIVATPEDCDDPVRLHELAMSTLNFRNHGAPVTRFEPWMQKLSQKRLAIESLLYQVISKESFTLQYQPIIDTQSGKVVQCEALLRVNDEEGKPVRPDLFISVAEDLGLGQQITQIVIRKVLAQQKEWRARGIYLRVAINVSVVDIEDPNFFSMLKEQLAHYGLSSDAIAIEITERTAVDKPEAVQLFITHAKSLGIVIEIDDFGVAQSSLHEITQIDFDILKIDKSFIDRIVSDKRNNEVVRFIIQIAKLFDGKTIAEGVETEEQLQWLKANGCDYIQGYLFSPPMSSEAFEAWYNARKKEEKSDA